MSINKPAAPAKQKITEQDEAQPTKADLSEAEVVEQLVELAPSLPRERVARILSQSYSGPLPHPDLFKGYGEVIENAPERILRVFEADSVHVRDMQRSALAAQREDNRRVHWMAFALIAGGFAISYVFAKMNKDSLAGIVLATTLVGSISGLIKTFGASRSRQNDPSDEPDDPVQRGGRKAKKGR